MATARSARAAVAQARRDQALALREAGATYAEIGAALGVSVDRARDIYLRGVEAREEIACGLSRRARGIVQQCGYPVSALVQRLAHGEDKVVAILRRRANCQRP